MGDIFCASMLQIALVQEKGLIVNSNPSLRRRDLLAGIAAVASAGALPRIGHTAISRYDRPYQGCEYLARLDKVYDVAVRPGMAMRLHRLHHLTWHTVRNSWMYFPDPLKTALTGVEWGLPEVTKGPYQGTVRASILPADWDDTPGRGQHGRWATHNGSGEDFLFFHRKMIARVDSMLKRAHPDPLPGSGNRTLRLVSWSDEDSVPPPGGGCPQEALPPAWEAGIPALDIRLRDVKGDGFFWARMKWWEDQFTDKRQLAGMTLGELGAKIEGTIHNQMHLRWAVQPRDPELGIAVPFRPANDISEKWDRGSNDSTFDEHSSHVSPNFWRLHKWVDNRINDWGEVHVTLGHVEAVENWNGQGVTWYRPKGPDGDAWLQVDDPWEGGFPVEPDAGEPKDPEKLIADMERAHRWIHGLEPIPGDLLFAADAGPRRAIQTINLRELFTRF